MRLDQICAHLRYSIWEAIGTEVTDRWYTHTHTHTHTPNPLCQHGDVTVL
jgi:hypothetical protein